MPQPRDLSDDDRALLADDAARADHTPTERTDWRVVVEGIAERSRPHRDRVVAERTARQRRIDDLRQQRRIEHTLAVLDDRFGRYRDAELPPGNVARWAIAVSRGQRSDGLVIHGGVGTGKTHQAVAAFRWLAGRGVLPAVAVAVPALLDGLRPGRQPVETLEACERARLLLLDDLAAERATDWTGEVLYRLIDARYARALPTIVTTNATGAMIREQLGDRVASRLNGLGLTVAMTGPDRRDPRNRPTD